MKATKLSTIAIAAGAVLGGSLMSGVAEAGSFSHGTKGAHAQGLTSRANGRSYIKGSVRDTACDSRRAVLYIYFGGGPAPRGERVEVAQCNKTTPFDFNSQHRPVKITVCTKNKIHNFDCREKTVIS
jgi:hypothetical protein